MRGPHERGGCAASVDMLDYWLIPTTNERDGFDGVWIAHPAVGVSSIQRLHSV